MRIFLLLLTICFVSCENKPNKKNCQIDFEIPKDVINSEGIVTDLKFNKNILNVSISNLRNDTLHFATPYLIFAKKKQQNFEKSDVVVKQFIPNIITDKVTIYHIKDDNKKEIINVDSSKTRDVSQNEFKLAPKEKLVAEYLLNCKESDREKYTIYFFESNRFNNKLYKKIKYPENGVIEIKYNNE